MFFNYHDSTFKTKQDLSNDDSLTESLDTSSPLSYHSSFHPAEFENIQESKPFGIPSTHFIMLLFINLCIIKVNQTKYRNSNQCQSKMKTKFISIYPGLLTKPLATMIQPKYLLYLPAIPPLRVLNRSFHPTNLSIKKNRKGIKKTNQVILHTQSP